MNTEMTIGQIGKMVCRELPERWELVIELQHGATFVSLHNPIGEMRSFEIDETLEETVIEAVSFAKNHMEDF